MSDEAKFLQVVKTQVDLFPTNTLCQRLEKNTFTLTDYQNLLLMIFHQTFQGPSTFALAGAQCPSCLHQVRDYLLHHADEEKSHWEWVINDLKNVGYAGPDPRELQPQLACQSYVAFNVYAAMKFPVGRLAIATVLESIGANYGKKYATLIHNNLQLNPNQITFFFGHGDTDVGHTQDILDILKGCHLTANEWGLMSHYAFVAGSLYRAMYDEAAKQQ